MFSDAAPEYKESHATHASHTIPLRRAAGLFRPARPSPLRNSFSPYGSLPRPGRLPSLPATGEPGAGLAFTASYRSPYDSDEANSPSPRSPPDGWGAPAFAGGWAVPKRRPSEAEDDEDFEEVTEEPLGDADGHLLGSGDGPAGGWSWHAEQPQLPSSDNDYDEEMEEERGYAPLPPPLSPRAALPWEPQTSPPSSEFAEAEAEAEWAQPSSSPSLTPPEGGQRQVWADAPAGLDGADQDLDLGEDNEEDEEEEEAGKFVRAGAASSDTLRERDS